MLICLKTRRGKIHIVNWTTYKGLHYTLCGKSYTSKSHVETFSSDNTFPDMCPNCYEIQETDNAANQQYDVRGIRTNHVLETSTSKWRGIEKGWDDVSEIYENLTDRYWPKVKRMRRKFPSEEVRINKTKRYRTHKSHGQSLTRKHK